MAKILVVDDEPDVELLIKQKFRRRIRSGELEFLFAEDGVSALEKLVEAPDVDMVLSDINMPRMDGLTLLDQLAETNPMIKAVIVSAYGDLKNIRIAMNRGAFDFVTKPIDFEDLEVTVGKTLNHLEIMREALASRDQLMAFRGELDVAYRIQQSILPTDFPSTDDYEIFASMTPAKDVGGDFYDFFELDDDRVGLAIADVSGKGIAAALFMAVSRTHLRANATAGMMPGPCLARVNDLLAAENDSGMFVTLFYGILERQTGRFVYANGGHNSPILVACDGGVRPLEATGGIALGVMDGMEFAEAEIRLEPGDRLLLFTDGVTEAMDPDWTEYGDQRLLEILDRCGPCTPRQMLDRVVSSVEEFVGIAPQADDITSLALRFGLSGDDHAGQSAGESSQAEAAGLGARSKVIILKNSLDELHRLSAEVEAFGTAEGLSEKLIYQLNLVLDELITNIVSYGYDDNGEHEISLTLGFEDSVLTALLEDDGREFDPLSAPEPQLDASIEDRAVGGLGVHFVKTIMDEIQYDRAGGRNRLSMRKRL